MTTKKKGTKPSKWVVIVAIIVLGVIEICALLNGINGTFRMTITAIIAGLAGYTLPQFKLK